MQLGILEGFVTVMWASGLWGAAGIHMMLEHPHLLQRLCNLQCQEKGHSLGCVWRDRPAFAGFGISYRRQVINVYVFIEFWLLSGMMLHPMHC